MLEGKDMMAAAQTGSGKTAAFLFPIIELLYRNPSPARNSSRIYPQALILAPTRELVCQIYEQAIKFSRETGLKPGVCYGGASFGKQASDLQRGCEILCATPGRLVDMVNKGKISLADIRFLVFDEADRMLDMGFEPQIRQIVEQKDMPGTRARQTCMFSATFPSEIQKLARDFMREYVFLQVGVIGKTVDSIKQVIRYVEDSNKRSEIMNELSAATGLTLVFVERKKDCTYLGRVLENRGYPVSTIHGDRSQHERETALNDFRLGKSRVLVATSVAARGIDIPEVAHVINFDLPSNIEDYVHRIGRTGRCGREGLATAFFNNSNANIARDLVAKLKESNQEIPNFLFQIASKPKKIKSNPRHPPARPPNSHPPRPHQSSMPRSYGVPNNSGSGPPNLFNPNYNAPPPPYGYFSYGEPPSYPPNSNNSYHHPNYNNQGSYSNYPSSYNGYPSNHFPTTDLYDPTHPTGVGY
eukprot:TRINITY_DN6056_c0_g1_i2.p1 TRINITY_DN6056_c0_g1~~TRINITY_DN6056_c0_g1_i2.p1  ORF type:complete len:471 (+),score=79.87 TRINITY_DN6056_c0_g1_i2:584-1996(+)